jgi:hypothetical protein
MCRFYHTGNTINLVTASVDASVGIVEHTIFIPDVVEGRAPTHGVIFAKHVAQIAKQQGRDAVGHGLSPLVVRCRGTELAWLSRCKHPRKVAARRGVLLVQINDYRFPHEFLFVSLLHPSQEIPRQSHHRNRHDPQVEPGVLDRKFDERCEEDREKRYPFHMAACYCCHPPPSAW